jgi:cytochrome b561
MSTWLQLHIFTGLVGPYMVLLHTSWKFNGIAGATTLLTVIIVISGFIGRYIFTRIPRTMDGLEIEGTLSQKPQKRRLMALWHTIHIPIGVALFISAFVHIGAALYYATFLK